MMPYEVMGLGEHYKSRQWLMVPSDKGNRCWLTVIWTLRNKFRLNLIQNTVISIKQNTFKNHDCKVFWPQWVYTTIQFIVTNSGLPNKQQSRYLVQLAWWRPGPWFNIKMSSYQYRKSHCGDKTVVRSSYLHNGISYTGKITCFYWISPQWSA